MDKDGRRRRLQVGPHAPGVFGGGADGAVDAAVGEEGGEEAADFYGGGDVLEDLLELFDAAVVGRADLGDGGCGYPVEVGVEHCFSLDC